MGTAVDARDEGAVAADGDDPLRQGEARAYSRAGRRRGRVRQVGHGGARRAAALGRRAHRGRARHAGAAAARRGGLRLGGASPRSGSPGLPFALLGWRAARRAGLSRQRLPGWFADQAKSLAIGAVLAPFAMCGPRGRSARVAARLVAAGDARLDRARAAAHGRHAGADRAALPALAPAAARARSPTTCSRSRRAAACSVRIAARARGEREDVGLERVRRRLSARRAGSCSSTPARRRPGRRARSSPRRARCSRTSSGITPAATSGG